MGEHIAIEAGAVPWRPADDMEVVEVLHQYDAPLIGVVRQGERLHLFRCVEGHDGPSHLWAYTALAAGELDRLRASEDLDVVVADLSTRRPTVLALATDDLGVTVSTFVAEPSAYDDLLNAMRAALEDAVNEVEAMLSRSAIR